MELKAKAAKARKDIPIDALAISVNSSFPQFDCQSSTRVAADDDADIRRYARTCQLKQGLGFSRMLLDNELNAFR